MNRASQLSLPVSEPQVVDPAPLESKPVLQRVTEVVLPTAPGICESMLLPMLEHLSRQQPQRWLTWIGSCLVSRHAFSLHGTAMDRLRRVAAATDEAVLEYAVRALSAGTSQTVLAAVSGPLSGPQLAALEAAAVDGNCFGIVLRRWG